MMDTFRAWTAISKLLGNASRCITKSFLWRSSRSAPVTTLVGIRCLLFTLGLVCCADGTGSSIPRSIRNREWQLLIGSSDKALESSEFQSRDSGEQRLQDGGTGQIDPSMIALLKRISFMAGNRYVTLADAEQRARTLLQKEKPSPPEDLKPTFEIEDKQIFLTIKFAQEPGKRYWFVSFDREFQVDALGSDILKE